jgi:hypothetical protein
LRLCRHLVATPHRIRWAGEVSVAGR